MVGRKLIFGNIAGRDFTPINGLHGVDRKRPRVASTVALPFASSALAVSLPSAVFRQKDVNTKKVNITGRDFTRTPSCHTSIMSCALQTLEWEHLQIAILHCQRNIIFIERTF